MLKSTRFSVTHPMTAILGVFMLHEAWKASQAVSVIRAVSFCSCMELERASGRRSWQRS